METCTICLSVINENESKLTLSCNHSFHENCIINWFRTPCSSGNCPLCNDNPHRPTRQPFYIYTTNQNKVITNRYKKIKNHLKRNKKLTKKQEKYIENVDNAIKKIEEVKTERKLLLKDDHYKSIKEKIQKTYAKMNRESQKLLNNQMKLISETPIIFF